jgi:TPR repeat protein
MFRAIRAFAPEQGESAHDEEHLNKCGWAAHGLPISVPTTNLFRNRSRGGQECRSMQGSFQWRRCAVLLLHALAQAQPVQHPAYLRALAELRYARAYLHGESADGATVSDEQRAIEQIDKAMKDVRDLGG